MFLLVVHHAPPRFAIIYTPDKFTARLSPGGGALPSPTRLHYQNRTETSLETPQTVIPRLERRKKETGVIENRTSYHKNSAIPVWKWSWAKKKIKTTLEEIWQCIYKILVSTNIFQHIKLSVVVKIRGEKSFRISLRRRARHTKALIPGYD